MTAATPRSGAGSLMQSREGGGGGSRVAHARGLEPLVGGLEGNDLGVLVHRLAEHHCGAAPTQQKRGVNEQGNNNKRQREQCIVYNTPRTYMNAAKVGYVSQASGTASCTPSNASYSATSAAVIWGGNGALEHTRASMPIHVVSAFAHVPALLRAVCCTTRRSTHAQPVHIPCHPQSACHLQPSTTPPS